MIEFSRRSEIPSTERLLQSLEAAELIALYGRKRVVRSLRETLHEVRNAISIDRESAYSRSKVMCRVSERLRHDSARSLQRVINLTGTVIHTNLGRAILPEEAVKALTSIASGASNLEYDLATGQRGDRDNHVEKQLRELTGAQAATVVNNNAAAVMLVLNTFANGREVPTSRGELVEIGGSFRMPDIMASSGCKLREVGTTNRTHLSDYRDAIGAQTGMVLKVHASNYEISGFTSAVDEAQLAAVCKELHVPFVVDLGSGSLIDLRRYGLPHEPMPAEAIRRGVDLVTFSCDKLLGGPQGGIIAGRADLIAQIKRNPMKRALRVDKMTLAALSAVLQLYGDPDFLVQRIPSLRVLARPLQEIRLLAERLALVVKAALQGLATVEVADCESIVGSGALPTKVIPSAGIAIRPLHNSGGGDFLTRIEAAFRSLPIPVLGRIHAGAFVLDLRCLEDDSDFARQMADGLAGWANNM